MPGAKYRDRLRGQTVSEDTNAWSRVPSLLVLMLVASGTVSGMVEFAGNAHVNLNAFDSARRGAVAAATGTVSTVCVVLLAIVVLVARGIDLAQQSPLVVLVVLPWLYALITELRYVSLDGAWLASVIVAIVTVIALWLAPNSFSLMQEIAKWAAIPIAFSVVLGVVRPEYAMYPDVVGVIGTADKGIAGGNILAGAFGHPNSLGIYAALCLPLFFGLKRQTARWAAGTLAIVAILWSGSRTALLATIVAVAVMLTQTVARRGATNSERRRNGVYLFGAASLGAAVILVPLTVHGPEDFSRRGAIWALALDHVPNSLLIGVGRRWFIENTLLNGMLDSQASSGHNLFVHVLTTGGTISFVLVAVLLLALVWAGCRIARPMLLPVQWYVLTLLAVSTFEFVWLERVSQELFVPVVVGIVAVFREVARQGSPPAADTGRLKRIRLTERPQDNRVYRHSSRLPRLESGRP